ncbi:MAG: NAD-dependent deacylase [Spirochaetota bacterium]|nr:MAG: NAD-dependent deacylase [Spirochaetota bacterium]
MKTYEEAIRDAARLISAAKYLIAFTGAGISVESGIPPFRGEQGLWSIYDPEHFEISYFISHPEECWATLKKIFYERFEKASPNEAHNVLSRLEKHGLLKAVITQNIDNLHRRAGSTNVVEYHGSSRELVCLECKKHYEVDPILINKPQMRCSCGGLLKPDFVFFGEEIPQKALQAVWCETAKTDLMLIIGTTGEIFPASQIPIEAKCSGAKLVEINVEPSNYSDGITDIYLEGKASEVLKDLEDNIELQI